MEGPSLSGNVQSVEYRMKNNLQFVLKPNNVEGTSLYRKFSRQRSDSTTVSHSRENAAAQIDTPLRQHTQTIGTSLCA